MAVGLRLSFALKHFLFLQVNGGVWNKALSGFWCNVKFSSSFTTEFKEIWKENLVIYQKSLKAFLQAPLQLFFTELWQ